MIITGIAHNPTRLHEKTNTPSAELIYLASKALREYKATRLITSLAAGWDQALAKAALELKIPYTVAIPYPGRDAGLSHEEQVLYYDLLARAGEVYQVNDTYCDTAVMECHCWRVDQSDCVLALWEYDFEGETFQVIDYALKNDKEVANLWKDWSNLFSLRKNNPAAYTSAARSKGAQIYPKQKLS